MRFSLKRKAYILVALMMLAVAASSMQLGQSYFEAERGRALDARRRGVNNTAAELNHLLTRGLDRLETVAALPALAYGLQSQERALRQERQIPAWTTLHYLFFESDVFTGGVVLLNRHGSIIWSEPSDVSRLDTPYASWPAVQAGLNRNAGEGHAFVVSRDAGDNHVLVGVALFDQQNDQVGVLVGAIPGSNPSVVEFLAHGAPAVGGSTHLVDGAGVVVTSTDQTRAGRRLGYWGGSDASGPDVVGSRGSGADELLVAISRIPVAGWNVVTEERAADALAGLQALSFDLWAGSAAFTLIMAGILLLAVVSVTGPIESLTAAAQRIRAGDLQRGFTLARRDELGVLADALTDMTTNLRRQAEELERTSHLAEAASRAKTEFLAKVSHEIRTPMNGVLGMTDLLLSTSLSATQTKFASTIQRSANSLLGLINDILDFSKIEAGKVELDRVVFSPSDVVRDVLDMLRESADSKGLTLTSELPAAPLHFWGDVVRVRQVLINLTGNAIKFTANGRVVVRAIVTDASQTLCQVRFEVQDTGIGIDAANRERVFQPFVQTDSSTTRLYGGTGLGLAITRELTEQMGGQCGVDSEPGQGSTFWFQLPLERAEVEVSVQAVVETPRVAPPSARRLDLRVLVVEDNPTNTMVAKTMLRNMGITVRCAVNGLEALDIFDTEPFDLVLMDLQMPQMGGEDATRAIRLREAGGARVPVIAVTASALPGDAQKCRAAGMDDLLTKPYTQAQLRAVVEQWAPARSLVEAC